MASNRVAVLQSNYLPWKGYFDIIHDADLFVFYDDVQYTKNDWRNRNRIKTANGSVWLTVPVSHHLGQLVCEVTLDDPRWVEKHFKTLHQYYGKAKYFERLRSFLEDIYLRRRWSTLSELNQFLIRAICRNFLGITTEFADSRDYRCAGTKLERLLDLLVKCGATSYVSGPAGRAYIDPEAFAQRGIELVFKDYTGYPEYGQFYPPYDHQVSILDLIFHTGPDAALYIWGWRRGNTGTR